MGSSYQVKEREGWLDLSRGFLMCLVFLYHSTSFYVSSQFRAME